MMVILIVHLNLKILYKIFYLIDSFGYFKLYINTNRKYWHSGAGQDGDNFDRYENELKILGEEAIQIDLENKQLVEKLWEQQLGIQ